MATIYLIEGPVGAGKSTFAAQLSLTHGAVHLNLDDWMVTLFRPDRPETDFMEWYTERKQRCVDQIWRVTRDLIDAGTDAVLELGLVQTSARDAFYGRVDIEGYELKVYVLDTPEDVRRERVRNRNREKDGTFKMEVSDEIFEIANRAWQPPDPVETRDRDIEFV